MPKITGGSLEAHREQTRQRVFDALTELMATRSFDALTMADLAASAGIGRTAIYNHFADKDAVVVAFAEAETSRYLEALDAALAGADTAAERMRRYVAHHLASSGEFHFGLGPGLYGMLSRTSLAQIREHVVAVEQVLRTIIDDGRASGEFTVDDVDRAMALIHAALQARLDPADATEATQEWILRGLGTG